MGLQNMLVLSQIIACVLSFISSFLIFVPLAVNQREFKGNCLLYATGEWWNQSERGVTELHHVSWGSNSACVFNIFMGVILMILSLLYTVMLSCYLIKQSDSTWLEAFITSIVCIIITVLLFASTLTLTAGFHKWCGLITSEASQIVSCELADFISFSKDIDIDADNFYTEMAMAEFGSWTSLVCWVFLCVVSAIKFVKFRCHELSMTSMIRERERLLQKVGRQPDVTM